MRPAFMTYNYPAIVWVEQDKWLYIFYKSGKLVSYVRGMFPKEYCLLKGKMTMHSSYGLNNGKRVVFAPQKPQLVRSSRLSNP